MDDDGRITMDFRGDSPARPMRTPDPRCRPECNDIPTACCVLLGEGTQAECEAAYDDTPPSFGRQMDAPLFLALLFVVAILTRRR
jgi:hypothetical protein